MRNQGNGIQKKTGEKNKRSLTKEYLGKQKERPLASLLLLNRNVTIS